MSSKQSRTPASSVSEFQRQMDTDMLRMMEGMHGPSYTGNPDIDFLTMMIPHHQGAVDMARLALVYGQDPLTRSMAEGIISNQHSEIRAMEARLAVLRDRGVFESKEFPSLNGTRGMAKP